MNTIESYWGAGGGIISREISYSSLVLSLHIWFWGSRNISPKFLI